MEADPSFSFNTDVLKVFGLENAPPEEQDKFFDMAGRAILTQVVRRIGAQLPEDKQEEFFRLFERPASDEEKKEFFAAHVPNFKDLLFDEVQRFKKEAVEFAKRTPTEPTEPD